MARAAALAAGCGRCYRLTVFGIGTGELLIIAIIALLLFPPHELPKMLRSVAKAWGTVRRTADEFKDAIMQEEAMKEVKDAYHGAKADLRKAEADARRELMKARMEARKAEQKLLAASRERESAAREEEAKKAGESGGTPEGDAAAAIPASVNEGGAEPATASADSPPPAPSQGSSDGPIPTSPTQPAVPAAPKSEFGRGPLPPPPPTKPAGFPPPKSPGHSGGSRGQGAA